MSAILLIGDVFEQTDRLYRERTLVDLILSSPPFLALRSYLPADHPLKHKEIGSEPTPAEYLDERNADLALDRVGPLLLTVDRGAA